MEVLGELQLKWSFGYNGSPLHFIDDNVLVYSCGNTLTFVQCDGKHIHSSVSEGKGVGSLTVFQKAGLLAYCETTLDPKIFILSYPSCAVQIALEGGAQLEYECIAFSGDGKKLASLSSVPDFKLVIWNCSEGNVVCQANIGSGGSQLSFNPLNWKHLCLIGKNRICLYNLEQCGSEFFLSPIEVDIPDRLRPVGFRVFPKLQSASVRTDPEGTGGRQERRNTHGIVLTAPPNMKQVLYKDSYDDFLQERSPVEPVSHSWSAQQTVYIGCEHGQLLLVDFESGIVSIIANPEITMQQSICSSSKLSVIQELQARRDSTPVTGHALLRKGAVSILMLSKRGLFMAGKDGLIQCFDVGDSLPLVDKLDVGQPIGSVAWSCRYDKLAIGTRNGAILMVDPMKLEGNGTTLVSDHHFSNIIGIDVVGPGLQYFVSCRCDGILEVWDMNKKLVVSNLNLNLDTQCTTLCCPTSCNMAIVGTESGVLEVVSLTDFTAPRLVQQMFLHRNPLKYTLYDQQGKIVITLTDDGLIFLHDCRPSSHLSVVGYIDTYSPGSLLDFSIIRDSEQLHLAILSNFQDKYLVILLMISDHILYEDVPQDIYADATKQLSNDFVIRQLIVLNEPVSCFKLVPDNQAVSLARQYLLKFILPMSDEKDVEWELSPNDYFSVGELKNGRIISSFHKWLGIGSADGHIGSLIMNKPEHIMFSTPHCYRSGGCSCLIFSRDGQYLITSGDSGIITCWRMKLSEHVQSFAEKVAAAESAQLSMGSLQSVENTPFDNNMDLFNCDRTWLETAKENVLKMEDDKYAIIKAELRQEISQLREKVLNMIAINEQLPDIERLDRQEFILDTEEHLRMQAEEDQLILQVTKEIELSNLACMFIREQIRTECWDGMAVKGHMLKAFNSCLEVCNYPLKTRSASVLNELNRIKALRSIENREKTIRQEVGSDLKLTLQSLHMDDLRLDEDEMAEELENQAKPKQQQEGKGNSNALLGSHAAQLGGACELLYDQFNLYSSFARKHQIAILEDCIYQIKKRFNEEFDEVFRQKVMEITRIKEKNIRIGKIVQQLKLSDAIMNPSLDEDETPEKLLVVKDSEVLVEKYISPEEEKKLEEEAKQEEKRRRAEMGDNPRERALDMMMGGRLEANVEEDLFKDLPRPDFLSKDPSEMSEEEIRMARDFEKKETEFLEEREKLKKAFEAELRKLQVSIVQEMDQFDERILKLFHLKIKIEMAIHQQELMMLCLTRALLTDEEVTQKEIQLGTVLEEKKISKVHIGGRITGTRRDIEELHEQYAQMVAEDRELDKSFKRDFSDCEPFIDLLYKLFRKRPRVFKLKQGPSNEGMKPDTNSQNPFAFRPSSSVTGRRQAQLDGNDDPMAEFDDASNMPEGLEYPVWDRFTAYRRRKVASEQKVKAMALKMAEMTAFLNKRQAEDDHVQQVIQDAFKELNKLQEDKMVSDLNLEIQFLLKQGQVEIDMGKFIPNFSDSVFVHRSRIEELNSQIKTLGEGKLHAMAECKDFKKGICMLEWEHQKMHMEAEDLMEKAKDIQMLRVTKELQQRLMEENVTSKDRNEIDTLEKTIELNQKMYKKSVWEYKRTLSKLESEINDRLIQNQHLDQEVLECQVSVAEQQQVEDLAGVPLSEANQEQRMNDIVTRQKLVETIKTQDNQISILRSELERLRMRAFPALVQVD